MTTSTHEFSTKSSRPLALTIVAWWLIFTGATSFYSLFTIFGSAAQATFDSLQVNPTLIITTTIISGVVNLLSGIGILKGFAWGRTLYLVSGLLLLISSSFLSTVTLSILLIGVLIYLIIAFILTRKSANDYFAGVYKTEPADLHHQRALSSIRTSQRSKSGLKRFLGILFSIGGGFFLFSALFVTAFSPWEMLALVMAIFLIPALITLAIGILFWGRSRWAEISGWTLAIVGAWTLFSSGLMAVFMQTDVWDATMAQTEAPIQLTPGSFIIVGIFSAVVCAAGAGLIYKQRMVDIKAAQDYIESENKNESEVES